MKKTLLVALTALMMVFALGALAQAETYAVVRDTDSLNIRSGPSASYTWLGKVERGGWVRVTGQSGNWYQVVTVEEGIHGYMSKNFLETCESAAADANAAVVQNPAGTRFLNLREQPSYDANVLAIFYNGDPCTILNRRSDGWYYVSVKKNDIQLYGYFRSEYLAQGGVSGIGTARVSTGNGGSLNLRSAPSYEGSVLAQIPHGATVTVLLKGTGFWQVSYGGVAGYVDASFLDNGTSSGTSSGIVTPGGNAVIQTGNSGKLNLREQYSTNAKVLGQYANGTSVYVLNKGTMWCQVQVGGQTGYMMTRYLNFTTFMNTTKTVYNPNGGTYVNLRATPEKTNTNVNVRVPVNATVTIQAWGDEWSQVSYNGYTGYMMSWFLK